MTTFLLCVSRTNVPSVPAPCLDAADTCTGTHRLDARFPVVFRRCFDDAEARFVGALDDVGRNRGTADIELVRNELGVERGERLRRDLRVDRKLHGQLGRFLSGRALVPDTDAGNVGVFQEPLGVGSHILLQFLEQHFSFLCGRHLLRAALGFPAGRLSLRHSLGFLRHVGSPSIAASMLPGSCFDCAVTLGQEQARVVSHHECTTQWSARARRCGCALTRFQVDATNGR